jgi:hypothetical protein
MLHTVLEEAERAVVEVEQYAHTVALLVAACFIVALLAVAPEGTVLWLAWINQPSVQSLRKYYPAGARLGLLMPM